jgi:MFS family permease
VTDTDRTDPEQADPGQNRAPARGGGLWAHRPFRRLWIGETVSEFGSQISSLALPLVAILVVHASTFQVGLLSACTTAAFLIVGLPAGAWVERMRFRSVLIAGDVIRAVILGSVPLAALLGALTIWQLYAVALLTGVATVFFDVAYMSYLPQLIDRSQLVAGNARLQASQSVSQIAGPSLGGALIQALTAPYAVLIDAVSFLWSAGWVAAIPAAAPRPERRADRHLGREIGEGLRFVLGNPLLRAIATCTGTANLFGAISMAVFYVLLARDLHVSPGIIGLISAVGAIGGLAGALLASRFAAWLGQGPAMWVAIAIAAPGGFAAPFAQHNWTLALVAAGQLAVGAGAVLYNVTQASFRQGLCPPDLLGRMNATMRFLVWGTLPLGGVIGGALGTVIGVRATLLTGAIGEALAFLPIFLSPLRRMRELPSYAEPDAPR